MRVSVLIASYNTRDLLLEAIASVASEPDVNNEVIVVDNASADHSAEAVAERFPEVRLVRQPTNLGFAAAINRAARLASGEHLLLLNPDASLCPGALASLVGVLERQPRAAAVGPSLIYPDGRPQAAAFRFPSLAQLVLDLFPIDRLADSRLNGRLSTTSEPMPIDHPLGACVLIRRAAWDDVGPLDEGYFMYVEEVDWCRRAHLRGWQIWHDPRAWAVHHGGSATRQRADAMFVELWRSRLRYYQRFHSYGFNRLVVHGLVRLGMRAEARRSRTAPNPVGRRQAVGRVRQLVG
jgi:GT2 family glycosyltransferase